jgi:hypothetical protein
VNCGFSVDHVISNDYSAVKPIEDEESDCHSFTTYPTYDSALVVCLVWSMYCVYCMLGQHWTRPEEEDAADHNLGFSERNGSSQKVHVSV